MEDLVSRESIRKNIKQRLMETALNTCGEETTMDEACVDIHDNRIDTWINEVPSEEDIEQQMQMLRKRIEQSDDCVSREAVTDAVENTIAKYIPSFIGSYEKIPLELARAIMNVPPVTPTYHKSATNGEEIIRAFPDLKYTIQNGRVVTTIGVASSFDLDWWNAPYKRGSEND